MRTFWDCSTCCVYGKHEFVSPVDHSIDDQLLSGYVTITILLQKSGWTL